MPIRTLSRREMLLRTSSGFGLTAFAGLAAESTPKKPHFAPKIKSVIFCFMSGGVSHVDSFDPKPRLTLDAGKPMPMPVKPTMFNDVKGIMPSPWSFRNYGQCGMPVSELFPHIGSCADDLCLIRSMTSTANEHAQGNYVIHTGQPFLGFPNAGAWINYGLGSENRNLPGFVVLASGGVPLGGIGMYGSGFLPAEHQASLLYPESPEALSNIKPKESDAEQKRRLAFVGGIDKQYVARSGADPQVETAIRNYETAYRMQTAVPELMELTGESEATKRLYGMDSANAATAAYGKQCLLARRLVERGVRFIELTCLMRPADPGQSGNPWDQHSVLREGHTEMALQVDQPISGLIKDLKSRGLLEQTLIVWAGEFGRTPFAQGSNGRDHNPFGFSIWLAGGGIKRGFIYGSTDEFGYYAVENKMTVYDLWATVLHLLGVDHERLTYRFSGRDYRLSDVHGRVMREVLG
jgi:hypothetical protein